MVNSSARIIAIKRYLICAIAMIQFSSKSSIAFTAIRQAVRSMKYDPNKCVHFLTTRCDESPRSSQCSSKAKDDGEGRITGELDWDHYEYSRKPKKDLRFDKDTYKLNIIDEEEEAEKDIIAAKELEKRNNAYVSLSPEVVNTAIKVLEPYVNTNRQERISGILKQRTKRTKFLFENPSNPSNVWACLRTIDSFGIQNVDVIIESGRYSGKQGLSQKRGMRTAVGSAQWLSLTNHASTLKAIREIRDMQGYKIYASDLSPDSVDVRDIDWDDGPICVVMGNEESGISEEMRSLADKTFTLPMCGFAESFNLSVATSITLAHMSANSVDGNGPLQPGDLDPNEYDYLYLKGLLNSLAQKRMGIALLRQNGITLPDGFNA